jgi:predicted acylesterase/phospholipase RssA
VGQFADFNRTARTIVQRRRVYAFLPCVLAIAGCVTAPKREPVTAAVALAATFPGYENIRYWGDEAPRDVEARIAARRVLWEQRADKPKTLNILAISGGGENGAFGAGILNGWTATGKRPEFEVVTGISTGALSAPFAFMGPAYDRQIKEVYTTTDASKIFKRTLLSGALGGQSFADSTPLQKTIESYATADLLSKIGAEHAKGRRLLIGTTNIDFGRPVIWDIGAIANSDLPDRLQLFRKILLASASIPGVFPPVEFTTVSNGKQVKELHVDGGVSNQVFAYPPEMKLSRLTQGRTATLYIIRNAKEKPDFEVTKASAFALGGRSTSVLVGTQGVGDLYRMSATAKRDGLNFRLIMMPQDFVFKHAHPFDVAYMSALYDRGVAIGQAGVPWLSSPPGM